jgi:hypothetical protein
MIALPELSHSSTLEIPVVGALSAIAGGLLLPVWWPLGAAALIPCVVWLASEVWRGVRNARARARWARRFPRQLTCRQLAAAVAADPGRYVVRARFFGGFDATPLRPVAILEDQATGGVSALHPASWRVRDVCERLGVRLVEF